MIETLYRYFKEAIKSSHESINLTLTLLVFVLISMFLVSELLDFVGYVTASVDVNALLEKSVNDFIFSLKRCYWYLVKYISNPLIILGIPAIFILQRLFPVIQTQSAFGRATRLDLLYTFIMFGFYVLIAGSFVLFMTHGLANILPELKIAFISNIPPVVQIIIGYLAVDFLGWFHHLVRHKVPFLWAFHTVHHSQTELNPFSNERVHCFDWFSANVIKFIPAFFFTETLNIVLAYIVIHKILDHFSHSNVRTNLGWLRFILVTPQSHRVHHSGEKKYYDQNFGVSLSIWDHLFGTQCKDYEVYPTTGVNDVTFPKDTDIQVSLLRTLWLQQLYPFRNIWSYIKSYIKDVSSSSQ
jgi:sterol desaturase/sphingolipid hydroxylase (fatty acid hydroxylase superfamily)